MAAGGEGAAVRAAAARALLKVLDGKALDDALAGVREGVAPRDRPLLAELAYGGCRWYHRLDWVLDQLLTRPLKARDRDLRSLCLVGLYQLTEGGFPAHAAVAATAGATARLGKRWATGLVNAVLRNAQRRSAELAAQVARVPEARWSQPAWLRAAIQDAWPEQAEAVFAGLLERPPMTLRVNLARTTLAQQAARLAAVGITARPVAGVPSALMLDRPRPVSELPGFAEGLVSVQDAGAQLAAGLLDLQPGMRVLDACAAPGGKSGHLLETVPEIRLTALDVDARRLEKVAENLDRLGYEAERVVGDAAAEGPWSRHAYDRILADVPCTATGVIRRHPDIKLLRRPEDLAPLAARQQAILERLWRSLRPGGKLLYATCSLLPEENEAQVARFLQGHAEARACTPALPRGRVTGHGVQLLPEDRETDGFYYAVLEKL